MQLDLVDGGDDLGLSQQVHQVPDHEVADADGADLAVLQQPLQRPVSLQRPAEVGRQRLVQDPTTPPAPDTIPSAVTVTGATAPVTIQALHQNGTLTVENNTAGVVLEINRVNGRVYVENNTASAPTGIALAGNTVNGSLTCTGNNPAPTDEGGNINTVSGTASGQCAAIAER